MIKTYKARNGVYFKGLKYTGKNFKEFNDIMTNPNNEMGIFVPLRQQTLVMEDASKLFFQFYGKLVELEKGDHFLYSKESGLFGVFNSSELTDDFEQVK